MRRSRCCAQLLQRVPVYGKHPTAAGGTETRLSLPRIKRDAIVKFYETNYTPGNTILAVAGEFNAAEMKKKLEEVFGRMARERRDSAARSRLRRQSRARVCC